ncbi:hypothetical protein OE88DRAFT_658467 [Heliocybe sulcata]|uniref:Uncharacterized protein n=1 Tax=Heliocybe sulcata TaxID=5364 RepID=A0A5C3ND49_9AGAM|nr:hypothetical protein OE88DRAFT_658467 [Heliocybe sulcata]
MSGMRTHGFLVAFDGLFYGHRYQLYSGDFRTTPEEDPQFLEMRKSTAAMMMIMDAVLLSMQDQRGYRMSCRSVVAVRVSFSAHVVDRVLPSGAVFGLDIQSPFRIKIHKGQRWATRRRGSEEWSSYYRREGATCGHSAKHLSSNANLVSVKILDGEELGPVRECAVLLLT